MKRHIEKVNHNKLSFRKILVAAIERQKFVKQYPQLSIRTLAHTIRKESQAGMHLVPVSFARLKSKYEKIVADLNYQFPEVLEETLAEKNVGRLLRKHTKIQFIKHVWIGTRNVDYFIYSVKSHRRGASLSTFGQVIEVDGKIHNSEFKIKKDQKLIALLSDLQIPTMCIANNEIGHPTVQHYLKNLGKQPRTTSFERKRLLRNIYWETILNLVCDKELEDLLCTNIAAAEKHIQDLLEREKVGHVFEN